MKKSMLFACALVAVSLALFTTSCKKEAPTLSSQSEAWAPEGFTVINDASQTDFPGEVAVKITQQISKKSGAAFTGIADCKEQLAQTTVLTYDSTMVNIDATTASIGGSASGPNIPQGTFKLLLQPNVASSGGGSAKTLYANKIYNPLPNAAYIYIVAYKYGTKKSICVQSFFESDGCGGKLGTTQYIPLQ